MTAIHTGASTPGPNVTAPDRRAERLAEALGGEAARSSPATPRVPAGRQGLREDLGSEPLQKSQQARALFFAQQIAQESGRTASATTADTEASKEPDAVTKFLDYMSKTPEERYYEALLAEEGHTPESLAALPPEARAAIEARIQERMQDKAAQEIAENLQQG